jgi:hypothetical protein
MFGRRGMYTGFYCVEPEGKKRVGRSCCEWGDYVKMNSEEAGREGVELIGVP